MGKYLIGDAYKSIDTGWIYTIEDIAENYVILKDTIGRMSACPKWNLGMAYEPILVKLGRK